MDVIVRRVRLDDEKPCIDIGIRGGRIAAIEEHLSICEECRNLVETVDTIRRALKSDPHGQAATLAQMLEAHRRVIETEMIEQRITDLEAKPENTSRKRAKKS